MEISERGGRDRSAEVSGVFRSSRSELTRPSRLFLENQEIYSLFTPFYIRNLHWYQGSYPTTIGVKKVTPISKNGAKWSPRFIQCRTNSPRLRLGGHFNHILPRFAPNFPGCPINDFAPIAFLPRLHFHPDCTEQYFTITLLLSRVTVTKSIFNSINILNIHETVNSKLEDQWTTGFSRTYVLTHPRFSLQFCLE